MRGYARVLNIRPFLWFWLGTTGSFMGSMVTAVALSWLVYERTHSTAHVGYMQLASMGPFLLSGLLASRLLDTYNRVTVMVVDNALRTLMIGSVPVLAALGWEIPLWYYYAVAVGTGSLVMLSAGGGPAVVNKLVGPENRVAANALESLSFGIGGLAGPALGGVLVAWAGADRAMAIDAVSYVLMVLCLLAVPRTAGQVAARSSGGTGGGTWSALRSVLAIPAVGAITWLFMLVNFSSGFFRSALPTLVDNRLGGGAALFGLLLAVRGAGDVTGSLAAGLAGRGWPLGRGIAVTMALHGAFVLLFVATPLSALVLAASLLMGVFGSPLTPWAQTIRMDLIPDELQGRAFALLRGLMLSSMPLAGALAGPAEALLGPAGMVVVGGTLVMLAPLFSWRILGAYDRDKAAQAA